MVLVLVVPRGAFSCEIILGYIPRHSSELDAKLCHILNKSLTLFGIFVFRTDFTV
jgi:hypothetical protein